VVMWKRRQRVVDKFYAATVEQRAIARHRHEYCPTAVIRYPDEATALRHDASIASYAFRRKDEARN
jgi:hypothetical protein